MVVLLVKWALAAISAMIILISIGVAISLVLGGLFGRITAAVGSAAVGSDPIEC